MRERAAVIIINYNGRRFLDELLQSLEAQIGREFETLLIDNHSQDGSAEYVCEKYPWVRVVRQSSNLGFSRAGNLGARICDAEYLVFLNTDMKLEPQWLEQLISTARQDPNIAGVASKLRLYDRPQVLNGVGGAMNFLGYAWDRGMFEEDRGQYDSPEEVLFASAGAALFRRSPFLEAGGFDERFFMYHEDVDLCWRLWLAGYRVVTAPGAVAYHHFSASTRQDKGMEWREVLGERHNIRALIKNYEIVNLVRSLSGLLLLRLRWRRKRKQIFNFIWNLALLPDTWMRRRAIQKQRLRSDAELKRLIVQSSDVPIHL
ncbi:MAG: glycosyltransferase family 2 protein [Acidobacteriota bacterium]